MANKKITLEQFKNALFKYINEEEDKVYLYDRVDGLMSMLRKKKKDKEVYAAGMEAIRDIYGQDLWEDNFDTFRKLMIVWMTDRNASALLPKEILDEYEFVTSKI
jgi:hypothetical protein